MFELFVKGGPIMWPILITSIVALTVVIERLFFTLTEFFRYQPKQIETTLKLLETQKIGQAIETGQSSKDPIVGILLYGLNNREDSVNESLLYAANKELARYSRGINILDTIVTLAPLLGLLGTVTGMIRAFGLLGASELDAPVAITGGIAEALIATAFGLGVAILALIPLNYLVGRLEIMRQKIQDATTLMEIYLAR